MPSPGVTKRMLADAMKRLMAGKPLSKISVGEIVSLCSLNRNSFYYHFQDKYDLVNWIFYTDFMAELDRGGLDTAWDFIEQLCGFFYKNQLFYLRALEAPEPNSFWMYMRDMVRDALMASDVVENEDRPYIEFYATFLVDAFLAAIYRWLKNGADMPPEQFAQLLRKASTGTAIRELGMS